MSEPLVRPQSSYEELLVENAQLGAELVQALAEIGELTARLGMTSKNSSKPPSSGGLTKPAPKSLRGKVKRGPGRSKGQVGFTLSPVDDPDHEQVHEPSACCGCGAGLAGVTVVGVERRQVFDLPPLCLEVTEHRLISRACSCGVITKAQAQAQAGVNAPVQYGSWLAGVGVYVFPGQFLSKSRTCQALADLFGAKIAASTLVSWVKRIAAQITSTVLPGIVDRIAGSAVAHFDETGFGAAGSLQWMHSASTPTEVLLSVHARRGVTGMDAAGVLPRFTKTAVHDAWAPYDTYTNATHALCNAHALRELIYVIDTAPPAVADLAAQGAEAMVAVNDLVDDARAGDRQPDPDRMAEQRHLLRSAFALGKSATAGRATKLERKYNSLFTRLIDRWEDY